MKTEPRPFTKRGTKSIAPENFDAVLFDMDGVVTRTAAVHCKAWGKVFNDLLQSMHGDKFKPFTKQEYLEYVDGKSREEGIKSFTQHRQIILPEGDPQDPPGITSVNALAKLKQNEFMEMLHTSGVEPYETTVSLIRQLREAGISTALVTASRNGREILRVTKLTHLFDVTVDGVDANNMNLKSKPAPDLFLEAARKLVLRPERCVVVEDAEAGVEAGHNGNFGLVIGVARQKNAAKLKQHGADIVVNDLADVTVTGARMDDMQGMALAELDITEANWVLTYNDFAPDREGKRESLCALGNAKFCTRGAAAHSIADNIHYPGTYIAGGYNSVKLEAENDGFEREELVNMPNWLFLTFRIEGGDWFDLAEVEILSYSQRLDLRQGILYKDITFKDAENRETSLSERRFVHMRHANLAGIELVFTPKNWSGHLTVRSAIDGRISNHGDAIDPRFARVNHLRPVDSRAENDIIFLEVETTHTGLRVAEAVRTVLLQNDNPIEPEHKDTVEPDFVAQDYELDVKESVETAIRKTLAIYTSRDDGIYTLEDAALDEARQASNFETLIREQIQAWRSLWRRFDLFLETTEEHSKLIPSLLLHLNSFHTLQTASPHTVDLDTGVPARGWTGEGYQGHVFWDDLFVFPFINLRRPFISAALLKYRYRRLGWARKIARSYGARGACFPWQSASDGRECTPEYWWMKEKQQWIRDYTHLELHVNGAIAVNIWQYLQVTADLEFMYSYGSEMLIEIARFFATYAKYNQNRDRYEIHGVIGPDEYHNGYPSADRPGLNNNAYTNILAVWTLCKAIELLNILPSDHREHLKTRLNITANEIKTWDEISRKMFVPFMDGGVISQFEGYEKLEEFPTDKDGNVDAEALPEALKKNNGYLNQYKVSKQADVLMLGYIFSSAELEDIFNRLGYHYSEDTLAINANYYIPRTANKSTLSRVAHAWVLSKLERVSKKSKGNDVKKNRPLENQSAETFYEALGSDYFDVATRTTAATGIHIGAMAGTVDIVQRCYTGIVTRNDVLWLDPYLPEPLLHLSFNLYYRGQLLSFDITKDTLKIAAHHSTNKSVQIGYDGIVYELQAGKVKDFRLQRP